MNSVAFVDCFLNTPVNHCVNEIVTRENLTSTYHMPCAYGLESLKSIAKPSAYIILGSATHVSEKLDWHKELLDIIIPDLESGIPVLGICFGHQLIADHYGCKVGYITPKQNTHTVLREIEFLKSYGDFKNGSKAQLAYAHAQVVQCVSNNIEVIAKSQEFEIEAIRHKSYPFYGFQSHPECSRSFLENELKLSNTQQQDRILSKGEAILSNFLKISNTVQPTSKSSTTKVTV